MISGHRICFIGFCFGLGLSSAFAQTPPTGGQPPAGQQPSDTGGRPVLQNAGSPKDAVNEVDRIKPKNQPGVAAAAAPGSNSGGSSAGSSSGAAAAGVATAPTLQPSMPKAQSNEQLANAVAQIAEQAPDFTQLRDPFKQPTVLQSKMEPRTPLETFPVDTLRMIAVMSGPKRKKALVAAPDGKNYIVMEKMKVGIRGGLISKITPDAILIREKIVNIVGEEEDLDTVLKMQTPPSNIATGEPQAAGGG
ncbi:MAG: pilus assembly protein PilP [Bdellovibrionales bacterium]|nr:pilus assembly protein PilP [Bdellovibrionales bacterium]